MSKRKANSPPARLAVPPDSLTSLSRFEGIALAAILALGVVLRWLMLERAAVEHFDEGVYASRFYFGPQGAWPMEHLYAPPLLPITSEWLVILLGPTSLATMLPGLLCGTLTIALVWWIGRAWFGPAIGLAAALLAATSEVHALFSRTALTDVPLTLLFLAALFAWERSVTRHDWRLAVLAGLLAGLAGLTKYNGWLPIGVAVIAAGAFLAWPRMTSIAPEANSPDWRNLVAKTALLGLIAGAIWAPYLWQLQSQGGYAAVARNHARYVVGLSGWLDSAAQQLLNHRFLESWITCAGLGGAWLLLSAFPRGVADAKNVPRALGQALLLTAVAALVGTVPLLALASAFWLSRGNLNGLGGYAAAVGWLLLLALTPLYHPYVRLTLPWLACSWLLAAAGGATLVHAIQTNSTAITAPAWRWLLSGAIALVAALALIPAARRSSVVWQPRTGMQQAASEFSRVIRERERQDAATAPREPAVFVFGEPAMVFHLRAAGFDVVQPVQEPAPGMKNANREDARVWLVVGPQGERDPAHAAKWPTYESDWELVATANVALSDLMLLDLFNPRQFAWSHPPHSTSLRLYVWRP